MLKFKLASLVLATLTALPAWASPHIYHVTNPADSGANTLRQAIIDGNSLPTNDFPDIRIDLGENQPILLQSSLPQIHSRVVYIRGTQSTPAVINGLSQYALLQFNPGAYPLMQLSHLVLRAGHRNKGGCLYVGASDGLYTLDDVEFNGCAAYATGAGANGGAIYAEGGSFTISNSQFLGNASTGSQGYGAAISFNTSYNPGAGDTLTIRDSIFANNTASGSGRVRGGAIHAFSAQLTITDSTFVDNWAVDENYIATSLDLGGAIYAKQSSVTVERSEFSQNYAAAGAAVALESGYDGDDTSGLTLVNSSFVDNLASSQGGAIKVTYANALLRNNSFFDNIAAGKGNNFRGQNSPTVAFYNNLFTNQHAGASCDISGSSATVNSGYNLIQGNGCDLENDGTSVIAADAHLQGYRLDSDLPYTVTDAPLRFFIDSPALDAGNAAAPDDNVVSACPELDGQGKPRAVDGSDDGNVRCDIGAFEWQHEASLFADDFEKRIHDGS